MPKKCIYCIYPSGKRPVTCSTADNNQLVLFTWVLPNKSQRTMKNERERGSSQYLQPWESFISPGRRQREGAVPCHCQQTLGLLPFPPGGEGMAQREFRLFNTDFAVCFVTSSSSMVPTAESMAARCKNPSPRADEAHSSLLC